MKVISLLQPWATLVVIGAKKIETRSWDTKHRGDLLVHSSKKMDKSQKALCVTEPFAKFLKDIDDLPLGAIIGKVGLSDTSTTKNFLSVSQDKIKTGWVAQIDWETELQFGNYSPDRYGWLLETPVSFTNHWPVNGSLGLWDFYRQICLKCGCTDCACTACIEKTGQPCHWVGPNLCSACV